MILGQFAAARPHRSSAPRRIRGSTGFASARHRGRGVESDRRLRRGKSFPLAGHGRTPSCRAISASHRVRVVAAARRARSSEVPEDAVPLLRCAQRSPSRCHCRKLAEHVAKRTGCRIIPLLLLPQRGSEPASTARAGAQVSSTFPSRLSLALLARHGTQTDRNAYKGEGGKDPEAQGDWTARNPTAGLRTLLLERKFSHAPPFRPLGGAVTFPRR